MVLFPPVVSTRRSNRLDHQHQHQSSERTKRKSPPPSSPPSSSSSSSSSPRSLGSVVLIVSLSFFWLLSTMVGPAMALQCYTCTNCDQAGGFQATCPTTYTYCAEMTISSDTAYVFFPHFLNVLPPFNVLYGFD